MKIDYVNQHGKKVEAHILGIGQPPPAAGLVAGMPNEQYHAIDAANNTRLKIDSQLKLWYKAQQGDKDTPAKKIGRAVHTLILEPGEFAKRYAMPLPHGRRSKVDKAAWEAWEAKCSAAGLELMSQDDWDQAHEIAGGALSYQMCQDLRDAEGPVEVSFFWWDEATELVCKGRADKLVDLNGLGYDIKTSAAPIDRFGQEAAKYDYPRQAMHYLEGLRECGRNVVDFRFLVVEKSEPYECGLQWFLPGDMDRAYTENVLARERYRMLCDQPQLDTRTVTSGPVDLPYWYRNREIE